MAVRICRRFRLKLTISVIKADRFTSRRVFGPHWAKRDQETPAFLLPRTCRLRDDSCVERLFGQGHFSKSLGLYHHQESRYLGSADLAEPGLSHSVIEMKSGRQEKQGRTVFVGSSRQIRSRETSLSSGKDSTAMSMAHWMDQSISNGNEGLS